MLLHSSAKCKDELAIKRYLRNFEYFARKHNTQNCDTQITTLTTMTMVIFVTVMQAVIAVIVY